MVLWAQLYPTILLDIIHVSFGAKRCSDRTLSPPLFGNSLYTFHIFTHFKKFYSILFPYDPSNGP